MGGKFEFRVKIVQTDLTNRDYYSGFAGGMYGGESPLVYQNSNYISKLYFINNYSGGILAKDRIEDMPERYRRFIKPEKQTEAQMMRELKKEIFALANREEVGQNIFYSSSGIAGSFESPDSCEYAAEAEAAVSEDSGGFYGSPEELENPEDAGEFEEFDDYVDDGEEIRNILRMNSFYNSDAFKMSRVEYDFAASGTIDLIDGGKFIELRYDESELTGFRDSYIQFIFDAADRDILTVRRKYFADVWFTLEKNKRVSVAKSGKDERTAVTVSAKELANNMTADGGVLRVAYIMEENGAPIEKISYAIRASRA